MLGGKRRATALEEMASAVSLKRTLAPQRILQTLDRHQTVQRRLAGKESRLAPMLVVLRVAQQPHPGSGADERCRTDVRERLVVAQRRWTLRQVLAELPVRHKKPCGNPAERHQPIHIGKSHVPRARPSPALIARKSTDQSHPLAFSRLLHGVRSRGRACERRRLVGWRRAARLGSGRSEEHTSELQSPCNLVCRLLLEKKKRR